MAKGDEITTKFSVDISDLKKGISEANQQIKLANAEFKAATAGMDDWASSADGIRAKLAQLDSTLDAQKKKLAAYQEELDRNEAAYRQNGQRADELRAKLQELADQGVDKTSEEYKKFANQLEATEREQEKNRTAADKLKITVLEQQAAVNKTEAEIGRYTSSLDELESGAGDAADEADELTESVDESGEAAEDAGDGFTVFGAVLADLAASAIKAVIQGLKDLAAEAAKSWQAFDDGADTVIAATGATGDAAEELIGIYKNVSRRVVGDFSDIGTAVGEVNTRFGSTGAQLDKLSEKFLKFATINGLDVKATIDDTQSTMAAFGMDVEDTASFLDVLNKAGQDTGVSLSTLLSSLKGNATALQELGYDAASATMFVANLDKSGVEASTVLAGMKKALTEAAKEGTPLSDAMSELENSIKNAESSTEAITIATELFGARSAAAIAKAVQEGRLSFADLEVSLHDFDGNLETTFNEMQDAPDKFALALQNVKLAFSEVAGVLLDRYGPQIEQALAAFTDDILPGIMDAFDDVIAFVEPIIRSLIDLVVAALPEIQRVWDEAQPYFAELFGAIQDVVEFLAPYIGMLFKGAWELIKTVWERAAPFFSAIWESIKAIFAVVEAVFSGDFTAAGEAVNKAIKKWVDYFKLVWDDIKKVFSVVAEYFGLMFGRAWEAIKAKFSAWGSFFRGLWDSIVGIFKDLGEKIGDAVGGAVKSAFNGIIGVIENTVNKMIQMINSVLDLISLIPGIDLNGIPLVSLPRLAKGGVLAKGQLGLLEGTGAEAVVPLDENKAWISAVAADMLSALYGTAGYAAAGANGANGYSFTQVINSPKAVSRIDIYRQTRNLLQLARDAGGV